MAYEERPSVRGGEASVKSESSLEELSASALQVHLKGILYPKNKQGIIAYARDQNAPPAVLQTFEKFEDKEYRSAAEVSQEFGKVK